MDSYKVVRAARRVRFLPWTATAIARESRDLPAAAFVPVAFLFAALALPAFGQTPVGLVGGIARDSTSGKPVAEAQIIAHNLDKGTDRSTVSDASGVFTFTNLQPGKYEVAAVKDGFEKSLAQVEVAASRTAQVELPLHPAAEVRPATETLDNSSLTELVKQMQQRIDSLEQRLAATGAAATEAKNASATQADAKPALGGGPPVASLSPVAALPPAAQLPPDPQQTPPQTGAGRSGPAPTPPTPVAPPSPTMPDALQAPEAPPTVDNNTPFAFGDFTWLNGFPRNKDTVLDTKFFTPEVRFDTHYMEDFNQPIDHTIVGATESFRSGEVQIEQASVGGDFHWENVRGRILFMEGLFATTTPRNDASSATGSEPGNTGGVGQWDLQSAYKYVSEAYGGYHFNVQHGLNVDAGIFVSYIGLFSYYNFDNWTYQPSYVSSNTPWFFNGVRVQWFPTNKLKIEPWFINGWQSYAKYNGHPGLGGQLLWSRRNGSSSSRTSMATERIIWVFPTRNVSTPTTASRSGTTTIRRAPASRRWRSLLPETRAASMAADFAAPAHRARARNRLWGGCSTTACGSTRICSASRLAAER